MTYRGHIFRGILRAMGTGEREGGGFLISFTMERKRKKGKGNDVDWLYHEEGEEGKRGVSSSSPS